MRVERLPLLAAGMVSMILAAWGGLHRVGLSFADGLPHISSAHGPLMVCGFLGTVICLERAVGLGEKLAYGAPVLAALGALSLLFGVAASTSGLVLSLAGVALLACYAVVVVRQPALFNFVMALGSLFWLVGNLFWLSGWPVPLVVPAWVAFLVLTVAGERLELTRLQRPVPGSRALFIAASATLVLGVLLTMGMGMLRAWSGSWPDLAARVNGLGLAMLGAWLLRFDIARRTIKGSGLVKFTAACLLAGHVWLLVGGLVQGVVGATVAGPLYDAWLHAVLVGFIFSMIFGHAPIIFPAVLGAPVPFHRSFYAHLGLLQVGLLARVSGDLLDLHALRQTGSFLNALALLVFAVSTGLAAVRGARAEEA